MKLDVSFAERTILFKILNIFTISSFFDPLLSFTKDIFDETCEKDRILVLFWTILDNVESKKIVRNFGVILASRIDFPRRGYGLPGGVENFQIKRGVCWIYTD